MNRAESTLIDPTTPPPTPLESAKDETAELVDELIEAMPAATFPAATKQAQPQPPEMFEANRPERDPKTGKVARTKDGRVRQARGRKPKPKPDARATSKEPETQPISGDVINPVEVQAEVAANALADTLKALATMLGGDEGEWTKTSAYDERHNFVTTWKAYFVLCGVPPLPAWAGPAIVTGQYIGCRINKPQTKTVVYRLWERGRAFVVRAIARMRGVRI